MPKYYIRTGTGKKFYFDNFNDYEFSIESIGGALSKICRFSGNVSKFYSVAEHSVLVSRSPLLTTNQERLAGLLHDAAECFVSDVPSPLKHYLRECLFNFGLQGIEDQILGRILLQFGLPYRTLPDSVKRGDRAMTNIEGAHLVPGWVPEDRNPLVDPEDELISYRAKLVPLCLEPAAAYADFYARYQELNPSHLIPTVWFPEDLKAYRRAYGPYVRLD